jgi:heme oxygenase (mycobilin-producing)
MATPAAPASAESPVVLINIFQVSPAQEEAFVAAWKEAHDHLTQQDGYVSTKLHESLQADARFRFVNVAQWKSAQQYQAAVSTEAFRQIAQRTRANSKEATPALYRVIAE